MSNLQPLLAQLESIPPRPVTGHMGEQTCPDLTTASFNVPIEGNKVAPEPPLLQAEQPQLPQPYLMPFLHNNSKQGISPKNFNRTSAF